MGCRKGFRKGFQSKGFVKEFRNGVSQWSIGGATLKKRLVMRA